jgi:hypothetical protein
VDLPPRVVAEAGIGATILAPAAAVARVDHPSVPVDLGGAAIVVAFYDGDLSGAISFGLPRPRTPTGSPGGSRG